MYSLKWKQLPCPGQFQKLGILGVETPVEKACRFCRVSLKPSSALADSGWRSGDAVGPGLGSTAGPTARPALVSTLLTPHPSLSGPPGRARLWVPGSWRHRVADAPTEGRFWGWGGSLVPWLAGRDLHSCGSCLPPSSFCPCGACCSQYRTPTRAGGWRGSRPLAGL